MEQGEEGRNSMKRAFTFMEPDLGLLLRPIEFLFTEEDIKPEDAHATCTGHSARGTWSFHLT
jgi:hypothetical protein